MFLNLDFVLLQVPPWCPCYLASFFKTFLISRKYPRKKVNNPGFRSIFEMFTDCDLTIKRKSIQLETSHNEKYNVSSTRGQVFTVSLGIVYVSLALGICKFL